MKLHSPYLNPFQPFPERAIDTNEKGYLQSSIEDNLSRSVFSAIANAESTFLLTEFLRDLASDSSSIIQNHIKNMVKMLRECDSNRI